MSSAAVSNSSTGALLDVHRCVLATRAALGRTDIDSASIVSTGVVPAAHRVENMTTKSLDVVTVTLDDGASCRMFRKQLHHASRSPMWESIPEEHRGMVAEQLDWLDELRVYRSSLDDDLPAGFRLPRRWLVDEAIDDEAATLEIWMELVPDRAEWTLDRYAGVARQLGEMAGRWPESRVVEQLGFHRRPLADLFFGKIVHHDLVVLGADEFWQQTDIAAIADIAIREDIGELARRIPPMLGQLESVPHGLAHGDATPDNMLEPPDESTVAIDWSYGHTGAIGSDLAQLLIGRVERGGQHPDELRAILATIRPAFLEGLRSEGCATTEGDVDLALQTHVAVRSVFSAMDLDHRPDLSADDRTELLSRRAAMARFCLDMILR